MTRWTREGQVAARRVDREQVRVRVPHRRVMVCSLPGGRSM
ncbi:hypothetical protein [Actinomadura nitritigenes]